jgi:hypothetical protein
MKQRGRSVRTARTQRMVPDLTRSADIKLNERLSFAASRRPDTLIAPGNFLSPDPPQLSRQAIIFRLAALFSFEGHEVIMVWFLALLIICVAAAAFMWRFERHLVDLTGPWISD